MNLFMISTSIRTAYVWVNGYERTALVTYHRTAGEKVFFVLRLEA